ncbi:hypothetical protein ABPG77_001019 [Micractinium sp. CCAP 211/92]
MVLHGLKEVEAGGRGPFLPREAHFMRSALVTFLALHCLPLPFHAVSGGIGKLARSPCSPRLPLFSRPPCTAALYGPSLRPEARWKTGPSLRQTKDRAQRQLHYLVQT